MYSFYGISDDAEPVFTTSRFGKPAIQMGRYRFNKWSGSKGPRARWICVKACYGCKATIITVNDEITKFCHKHSH